MDNCPERTPIPNPSPREEEGNWTPLSAHGEGLGEGGIWNSVGQAPLPIPPHEGEGGDGFVRGGMAIKGLRFL